MMRVAIHSILFWALCAAGCGQVPLEGYRCPCAVDKGYECCAATLRCVRKGAHCPLAAPLWTSSTGGGVTAASGTQLNLSAGSAVGGSVSGSSGAILTLGGLAADAD
jgi:hypothetical protein